MVDNTWEKALINPEEVKEKLKRGQRSERLKFLIAGGLVLGAIAFLIVSGTMGGARFFITVEEVVGNADYLGQNVRITGAVIGESIAYDPETGTIEFDIAHLPNANDVDDLAVALHIAANDRNATRLSIYMTDQALPDLLQHEAQAILTGRLGEDGIFHATELLLKCPSRFEEGMFPDGLGIQARET